MERLRRAGIRAGVLMAPLLPGLSARPESIAATARAASEHGAAFLGGITLHLGPGVREHFLAFVEREYPALGAEYARLYGHKYAPGWLQRQVDASLRAERARLDLDERYPPPRAPPPGPVQLRLEL